MAAMISTVRMNYSEITDRLMVDVKLSGLKVLKFRIWLGGIFFKLGARIIGCGINIEK